jgi:putative ABC transport system permease protein
MIRNYLVLFIRSLSRQKLFSTINLLGLTVSITSTLLVYLYVSHEFGYDKFHFNSDRLYRVNQTFIWGENNDSQFSRTGPGVAHAIKEELAETELVTSLHTPGDFIISYTTPSQDVVSFEETEVLAADTNFFRVLNFPLIRGDASAAFRNENTLMLTRSTATKYFGDEEPVGKFLKVGAASDSNARNYEVTGVIEDVPENSTIQFDVLLSSKNFNVERMHWSWVWTQLETFVLFSPNTDIEKVRSKLAVIPEKRAEETLQRAMNVSYAEYIASGKKWELFLQPITSLHLPESRVLSSFTDTGNLKILYSLIGAAIFILFLSCINFMNLSTAQFSRRVKEAGVRKILGLGKVGLGVGYFTEALILCFVALVAALALTQMLLPSFNMLTGKQLEIDFYSRPQLLAILFILIIIMASVSSLYPAVFLSSFRPVEAVKGRIKVGTKGTAFRNGLVVFQFSLSIILIICTAVVFQQLRFVSEKDLGFDKENVIRIKHAEGLRNPESLVRELETIPGIIHASLCTSAPPEIYGGDAFTADGMNGENFSLNFTTADETYIPALGIKLIAGRNFSKANPSDEKAVIVNESALRRLGWPNDESVLGKRIFYPGAPDVNFEVIGVTSDFNYWTLAADIEPMGIFHVNNREVFSGNKMFVVARVDLKDQAGWERISAALGKSWKTYAGDVPFEFGFIDDYFDETFKTQQRFGYVLVVIAGLAIMIACLGLLGMIIYSLEQRTKEIGIRKVSGASSWDILSLISGSYLKLIIIAFIIGSPLSYFMMKDWLQEFSYRVVPSPWIFAAAGLAVMLVASMITAYHSLKAARTNPVDVLKDE